MSYRDVFISYKSEEIEQARAIKTILEKNRISCWMAPDDIKEGEEYLTVVPYAIKSCRIFLLLISSSSNDSIWLPKELDAAVNNGKIIMPFFTEHCDIPDFGELYLADIDSYEAVDALVDAINKVVNHKPTLSEFFSKKWIKSKPYKNLSNADEYFAMNIITCYTLSMLFWVYPFLRDLFGSFFIPLIITLVLMDLVWYTSPRLVQVVARAKSRKLIAFFSILLAVILTFAYVILASVLLTIYLIFAMN